MKAKKQILTIVGVVGLVAGIRAGLWAYDMIVPTDEPVYYVRTMVDTKCLKMPVAVVLPGDPYATPPTTSTEHVNVCGNARVESWGGTHYYYVNQIPTPTSASSNCLPGDVSINYDYGFGLSYFINSAPCNRTGNGYPPSLSGTERELFVTSAVDCRVVAVRTCIKTDAARSAP